jgi:transcription antitermination factor NusB
MALQALYQADLTGDECLEGVERTLRADGHPAEIVDYAFDLARGVRSRLAEIDGFLAAAAQHWSIHRMAVIDRNVLRLGIEELTRHPDVPPRVVINEAIEMAKRFSTSASGAFVNGVLDRIRRDLEARGIIAPSPAAPAAGAPAEPA